MIVLSILYFTSFIILLLLLNLIIKKVYTQKAFCFGLLFFFLLIPATLFANIGGALVDLPFYQSVVINYSNADIVLTMLVLSLIIAFIIMLEGFSVIKLKKRAIDINKCLSISKCFMYFTLVVGGLSFFFFIIQFDSISQMLSYGEYSRSFLYDISSIISIKYARLIVPARMIMVSPLLCIFLYSNTKEKRYFILFVVSIILAGILMLYNSGKTLILTYFLCFAIPVLKKRFKHPWIILIISGFAFLPVLGFLDSVFSYLTTGSFVFEGGDVYKYLSSFSYPFKNFINRDGILSISGFRYGKDFVTSFLSLIPGLEFEPSYVPTSIFHGGVNWRSGTPNDFLMFSYLQAGYIGIILISFFIAAISKRIDDGLQSLPGNYGSQVIVSAVTIQFFSLAGSADLCSIIKSNYVLVILFIVIILSTRKS